MDKTSTSQKPQEPSGPLYKSLQVVVLFILNLAAWAAALLMTGLLSIGVMKLATAVWVFWRVDRHSADAMHEAIDGFEFLLLAPLGYFLLVSLARYAFQRTNDQTSHKAKAELLTVKALSIGLLVAILAANLVGRFISDTPFNMPVVLTECLAIGVIAIYCVLLEVLAERLERA